jgi:flagellar biosynthesis GTPase FlhF
LTKKIIAALRHIKETGESVQLSKNAATRAGFIIKEILEGDYPVDFKQSARGLFTQLKNEIGTKIVRSNAKLSVPDGKEEYHLTSKTDPNNTASDQGVPSYVNKDGTPDMRRKENKVLGMAKSLEKSSSFAAASDKGVSKQGRQQIEILGHQERQRREQERCQQQERERLERQREQERLQQQERERLERQREQERRQQQERERLERQREQERLQQQERERWERQREQERYMQMMQFQQQQVPHHGNFDGFTGSACHTWNGNTGGRMTKSGRPDMRCKENRR